MNNDLPEGWTLSEPTPMMHGQWFATFLNGHRIHSIVLIDAGGDWYIQNSESRFGRFDSAGDAIRGAVDAAAKECPPVNS